MSLIVVVASDKPEEIEAYSDSRVSSGTPILDSVAKLLSLPVKIFDNSQNIVFSNSFGFAFAGSTLVALSVYSFTSATLQTLRSDNGSLPTLEEIARHIAIITKKIAKELGEKQPNPKSVQTALFIFGYCPIQQKRKLFKIETQISDASFDVGFGELEISETGRVYSIGDKSAEEKLWKEAETNSITEALKNVISSEEIKSVGGGIQAMVVSQLGAQILPTLHRTLHGTAIIKFLNHELDDINIGPCHLKNKAIGI